MEVQKAETIFDKTENSYIFSMQIQFLSPEQAKIINDVISIDKELKENIVKRIVIQESSNLIFYFDLYSTVTSQDSKKLKQSVNGLIDNMSLILQTIEQFQP